MSVTLARVEPSIAGVGDYIALMKPRVMSLVVFTALVGLVVAPGHVHPVIGFTALLCIAVGAGAAGALNMWYDADIDARMARTAARPIPRGRITPGEAAGFGLTLAAFSIASLGLLVNWVAAALLAFTIFFYVVIYTIWLKRSTPQNIVIGGAAGAFPPMIGWAAATGSLAIEPILLFLIIFFWTPPHFWALALYRTEDYARAGIPMLPVVAGAARDAAADPALYADPRAAGGCAVVARLCRAVIRRHRLDRGRGHGRARSAGARRTRRPNGQQSFGEQAIVRLLDPLLVPAVCHAAGRPDVVGRAVRRSGGRSVTMNDGRNGQKPKTGIRLTVEQQRARRARSIAIAVSLGVLVVLYLYRDAGERAGCPDPAAVTRNA